MIKEAVYIEMCGSPETASGKCYRKYHEFHCTQDQMMTHFNYTQRQLHPAETQFKHTRKVFTKHPQHVNHVQMDTFIASPTPIAFR